MKEYGPEMKKHVSSKGVLFSLALAFFVPTLGASITNVALPTFAENFNKPMSEVNWIVIAYLISITSLIISAGVLGDKYGRKRVLLVGIGSFFVFSVLCALATNLWSLIVARLLQGAAAAFILSQTLALAGSVLPRNKTGSVLGLLGTMAALGTALGPMAGGIIVDWLNWQFIFWLMLPLSVVSYLLCSLFIRDKSTTIEDDKKFDYLGTFLLSSSCLLYALSATSEEPFISSTSITCLVLSMCVFTLFLQSQRKLKNPLIDLSLFDYSLRNATLITGFVVDAVAMSTLVVGPFYLSYRLNLSPSIVGLVISAGPIIAAISGIPSGKFVDKFGVRKVMIFGLIQMEIGIICFAILPIYLGLYGYLASLAVLTPGRQMFLAANQTFVLHSAAASKKGLLVGVLNLSKNLGLLTGASLMAGFFALRVKSETMPLASNSQLNKAFSETFLLAALFLALCIFGIAYLQQKTSDVPNESY